MVRANMLIRDDYRQRLLFRAELRARFAALRETYDAFLLPASSGPAPEGLGYTDSRTMLSYCSFLGLPVPVVRVRGGYLGDDYSLLQHTKWAATALDARRRSPRDDLCCLLGPAWLPAVQPEAGPVRIVRPSKQRSAAPCLT
jgi:hypothetical protein